MKVLFTPAELAERWECSVAAIRAWIQNGTLAKADVPGVKIAYEEVRLHERVLSYGKNIEERELIDKLAALTAENDRLREEVSKLRAWKEKVISILKGGQR